MISIKDFCKDSIDLLGADLPWIFIASIRDRLAKLTSQLNSDFVVRDDIAVHRTAVIEEGTILKGPIIIGEKSFVGAHAYLRGGVFIGNGSVVGPGCEVKSSVIMNSSSLAHFNFVGDSIIGTNVNMEGGSVIANHYNERIDKRIYILVDGHEVEISTTKFGAVVGDGSKIGANAVLSPGTILKPNSIVRRLELVEQVKF